MLLLTQMTPSRSRCLVPRTGGFGLLQVLLLIAVMAGLASIGYLQWRERSAIDSSRQERQALAQADRAIVAFATVMRRLPCPDTDRDGTEDCGAANQKGWLPSVTLRLAGADPGVDVGQLRYLVQRQGGEYDLTELSDSWQPLEYDEDNTTFFAGRGSGYPTDIMTLTDLCQRLDTGRTTPLGATMARVNAAPIRTTAYALAHPGDNDADGDGDLFDGANSNAAANANLMEDPIRRPLLAGYNDVVLERSYASLLSAFHCRPLIDSINTVALGHDVAAAVAEMQSDNISEAKRAVAFNALDTAMTALEIALTIAEGASDAGNAAVDWAICAASLGLAVNACAAAPQHTAAVALAGGVIYADGVAAGLFATATAIAAAALKYADAGATPDQVCPPLDPSLNNRMLAAAQQEVTDANNELADVNSDISAKQAELATANTARNSARNYLYDVIRSGGHSTSIDGRVTNLLNAADAWAPASYNRDSGNAKVQRASNEVTRLTGEVDKYQFMIDHPTTARTNLNNEIAALNVQIALTSDPTAKENLENQRSGKEAELKLLDDPTGLQTVHDKAAADLAAAQSTLDSETAQRDAAVLAYNTAQANYQQAFDNLWNAGNYTIYDGDNHPIGTGCTGGCGNGVIDVSSNLYWALADLFGYPLSSSVPDTDAKYLKPFKIQKELDALAQRKTAAEDRVTNANARLAEVQQRIDNPAACNVPGSSVVPMTPDQAQDILIEVDRKGGTR
jgi:hypothetical protein